MSADNLGAEQALEASRTAARSAACAVTRQIPLDCRLLQVQREAWATDLDLPAFAVTAEQVAEVSIKAARSAACAVTRKRPLDCRLLQVQREAWATDLDLPAFAVRAEQAERSRAQLPPQSLAR